MFPECIPVATLDRAIVPKWGANAKRVHEPKGNSEPRRADRLRVPMGRHPRLHHSTTATLTRSIRDRGCTHGPRHETGHAVPESNPKSRVGRCRAVARRADNQARAMAAIAVGEREEWAAPQRVKPVHSGVPYVQLSRIWFPPWYPRQLCAAVCEPASVTRLCGAESGACAGWSTFPLVSALRSTDSAAVVPAADCSAADRSALFVGFTATMAESGPRPRRDDNASHNGIAHIAFDHRDSLRSREFIISWLNHTPPAPAVYASCSASPPPHATLATRRLAKPFLGRTCTG
jgi:hypothetical protein